MKCLCFSDSHGSNYYIRRALLQHPDAEAVFFLGDGLSDIADIIASDRARTWLLVRGNCDYTAACLDRIVQKTEMITLAGRRIVYTHGDLYGAKYGSDGLLRLAESRSADIVLFGHTHIPFEKYFPDVSEGGVYLFNPGSIGLGYPGVPSYGVMTLTDGGVLLSHCSFA